ncbi:hypothetical protein [Azospirillum halopraeferens]|uniref:hypothetical protein n=1 Tax=Azospirillum halopraeferens TaxID=34010 RepID=UPI0004254313|nr:hypothetical protein [Azospirillum halopraeferens]
MSGLAFPALAAGVAATAALLALGAEAPGAAAAGYLAALSLWGVLPAGALALMMGARLFGGESWALVMDRSLAAAGRTLVPTALLFVPLLLLLPLVYPWAAPQWQADNPVRALYLNTPFFIARTVAVVVLWAALYVWVRRSTGRAAAAVGLVVYALTATVAGVDWVLSRDPAFNASQFGLYFMAHQIIAAFAFAMLGARLDHALPRQLDALAGMLLAGALVWSYLAYMQYLVAWSGDLPAEAAWYLDRGTGVPGLALVAVVALQAVLPVVVLPLRRVRHSPAALKAVAGGVLAARAVEAAWLVLPSGTGAPVPVLLTIAALVAVGGVWCAMFLALRRV